MTKLMIAVLALFSFPAEHSAKESANPAASEWVQNQINQFEQQPYSKDRVSFQRPFAWGFGTYRGQKFEWFAYSNTDAYLQIRMSVQLTDAETTKVEKLEDDLKRPWVVELPAMLDDQGPFGIRTKTWIGTSNDWIFSLCDTAYNKCDGKKAIEKYLRQLNNHMRGTLALRTMEYLQ